MLDCSSSCCGCPPVSFCELSPSSTGLSNSSVCATSSPGSVGVGQVGVGVDGAQWGYSLAVGGLGIVGVSGGDGVAGHCVVASCQRWVGVSGWAAGVWVGPVGALAHACGSVVMPL